MVWVEFWSLKKITNEFLFNLYGGLNEVLGLLLIFGLLLLSCLRDDPILRIVLSSVEGVSRASS